MKFHLAGSALAVAWLLVQGAQAAPTLHGPVAAAAAIAKADANFATLAARIGTAKAFGEVMDPEDGLKFSGAEPTRGAAAILAELGGDKSVASQGLLAWVPDEVFASTGGDMGVSWGHWTYTPPGADKPKGSGRYVTVWRKDSRGVWRGLLDIGDADQKPKSAS